MPTPTPVATFDHLPAELAAKCVRVQEKYPDFSIDQVMREARFLLARKADRDAMTLEQLDAEAHQTENELAHADDANQYRAFSKRAMLK